MKTASIARSALLAATVLMATNIFAQDTIPYPYKTLPPVRITRTNTRVPEKVWISFRRYFDDAESSKWYYVNKNFLVKFMKEDTRNNALFEKNGYLIYNISYGYENNLPDDVRKQIKATYTDYKITRAIKVTQDNRLIWVVNLEDAHDLVMVRVENGELDEVRRMKKDNQD